MADTHIIYPSRRHGRWFFDDPATGLVQARLLYGIDTILDLITYRAGLRRGLSTGVKLTFSTEPFDGAAELVWSRADAGGNWYRCPQASNTEGWLSSALHHYFPHPPQTIYFTVERCSSSPRVAAGESSAARRRAPSPSRPSPAPAAA